jgi:hypothetical protein
MKIRPVGAEMFHVDGRTGMMKVTVTFRNVPNTNKNGQKNLISSIFWNGWAESQTTN